MKGGIDEVPFCAEFRHIYDFLERGRNDHKKGQVKQPALSAK